MKTIDRLIMKAKKKCGVDRLGCGIISPSKAEPGKWAARGDLWNGVRGSGVRSVFCGEHGSVEEAGEAIRKLGEKYPDSKDVAILINDLTE